MRLRGRPTSRRIVSGGRDATCRLWNADGTAGPVLRGHACAVMDVAFANEGNEIVSASRDCTIRRWNAATGEPLDVTALLPNDQMVALGPGGEVRFATPDADDELVYIVEKPSGEQEMLTPQEFRWRTAPAARHR